MKYSRKDAKAYAREHMKGIWAAALMPFKADLSIDEDGFRRNVAHWTEELGIDGLFIAGKQGEFFSMSIEERKRAFDLAVAASAGRGATIMSCSDQNLDVVIELARHAQAVGAPELAVPRKIIRVAEIPVLGTGKTDYPSVQRLAEETGRGRSAA